MKHEELKQALDKLKKVLLNPSLEPNQVEQLQRARRDLEKMLRAGKLDRDRLFRIINVIATVLLQERG